MDSSYDVIVVGAGPAGSMAALSAAQCGARTLLLEKHERVGAPVCCAEGITTGGLERVVAPRPEWIASTIEGARIEGPQGKSLTFLHPAAGYILNREKFDSGLAEMAIESGAELATCSPVVALKFRSRDIIDGVIISDGRERTEVRGRIFIAADGVESRMAYMAGLDTTAALDDIDSACQYLAGNVGVEEGIVSLIIGNKIAPGGYIWVFPKSGDTANIGVAICPSRANGRTAQEYLDRFMAERYPGYERIKTMMGVIPAFNRNLPLLNGNLLLVGDAARVVDSLSGAGISNALISGQIAGKTAAAYLCGEAELADYARKFMKLKRRELYAYRLFRSMFIKIGDREFEDILKSIEALFPIKKSRQLTSRTLYSS